MMVLNLNQNSHTTNIFWLKILNTIESSQMSQLRGPFLCLLLWTGEPKH